MDPRSVFCMWNSGDPPFTSSSFLGSSKVRGSASGVLLDVLEGHEAWRGEEEGN